MTQNKLVEALKEHSLEVIVLSLYFIFPPAKYVAAYKSWPETEYFLISASIFLLSIYFLLSFVVEDRRILAISNKIDTIYNNIYKKTDILIAHFKKGLAIPKISKNKIILIVQVCVILSGLMTFISLIVLQKEFIEKKSEFFWIFILNYIEYLFIILIILSTVSWFIKEFEGYIKKC
jgi:hypothetical protein